MMVLRIMVQTVLLALQQIWSNKARSALTCLGIIIGVASIIAVIAALGGLRANILSEFETFGTRKVFIDGDLPRSLRHKYTWGEVQLTIDEVRAIDEQVSTIDGITPIMMNSYQAQIGSTKADVPVTGIWPVWHEIEGRSVVIGRTFVDIDETQKRLVCLINDKAIEELDLPSDPTGYDILLAGRTFRIVGVVETLERGAMFGGGESSAEIFIPFSVARDLNPFGWIRYAVAQLRTTDDAEDAIGEIMFVLKRMREQPPGEEPTYEVDVVQQFIDQFNRVAAGITAGASGIVAISLLVGGIGIMNIMLVSVSERTREIGLRKAMGARSEIICLQFLVEAVTLCLVGGAIGLAIGQGLVQALRAIPDIPLEQASVPGWAVMLSVGFSAATGVIFGLFPAIKAARLDPIVALRHE